jgi:hypothetical protein
VPAPEITWTALRSSQDRNIKWRYKSIKQDKFRRRYVCWLDRNNGDPTGMVERVFRAPVEVPDEFLAYPEDRPWRVDINFEAYARMLKKRLEEWEFKLQQIMLQLPGGRGRDGEGRPSEEAVKMAGVKPQDWRLVVLAAKGDPWCLGLTKKRTRAVIMILGRESEEEKRQREAERRGAIASDLSLGAELDAAANEGSIGSGGFEDEEDEELPAGVKKILRRQAKLEREAAQSVEVGKDDEGADDILDGTDLDDDDLDDLDNDDDIDLSLDPDLENALDEEEKHDKDGLGGGKKHPVRGDKATRVNKAAGGKGRATAKSRAD